MFSAYKVIIKGGGDLASAVAYKLHKSSFPVIITETPCPKMVRRAVSFGNAVYKKKWTVEDVTSELITSVKDAKIALKKGHIPVIIDPKCNIAKKINPTILVDCTLSKKNIGTSIHDAPIVIALGPGYIARKDVHAVIETKRGHNLGRVILSGSSIPNTGIPGNIAGFTHERVFRAPKAGKVKNIVGIGTMVSKGDILCKVDGIPVKAKISGIVRGIIHDGLVVKKGEKLGDVDPRGEKNYCYSISDKGRTIAGGVLEAILYFLDKKLTFFNNVDIFSKI